MPSEREPHPDDLMTTGDAARMLGLSTDMVRLLERDTIVCPLGERPTAFGCFVATTSSGARPSGTRGKEHAWLHPPHEPARLPRGRGDGGHDRLATRKGERSEQAAR
jgi:hypothetical protein